MKTIFLIVLLIHGLVHLIGHYNAYHPGKIDGMTLPVSRNYGFLWLTAALLICITAGLLSFRISYWWLLGIISLLLSQFLIIRFWQDARYGTIGNVILVFGIIVGYSSWSFHQHYRFDVNEGLTRSVVEKTEILDEKDIADLPDPVRKYLRYTGAIGKPKVRNFKVRLKGEMRQQGKDWFKIRSEQYNFLDEYERLFYLRASVKGMPVIGYHEYQDGRADMNIKALAIFPVVHEYGQKIFEAETVTLFNDMCVMAPASLIDRNITWQEIDNKSARAYFTNGDVTVAALLEFNEQGELVNFVSEDRYNVEAKGKVRFSTPVSNYQEKNGYRLATYGEAVWHYPDHDFIYGRFKIRSVSYNVRSNQQR